MYFSFSAVASLICARVVGHSLFVCVLFGIIGFLSAEFVCGIRLKIKPYTAFILFLVLGIVGEILAEGSRQSIRSDGLSAAWLLFLPTLFFLSFTPGIRSRGRKYTAVVFSSVWMLLHIYAAAQIGIKAAYGFLPLQLAMLFVSVCTIKRKNDA